MNKDRISEKYVKLKKEYKKIYTNIIWNELQKYSVEQIFENEMCLVFVLLRREKKSVYFLAAEIKKLNELMAKIPKGYVLEYQYRGKDELREFFLDMGYEYYANYIRVTEVYNENRYGKEKGKLKTLAEMYDPDSCIYAEKKDIDELDYLTRKHFDVIGDDMFSRDEWEKIVADKNCMVIKEREKIVAFYIWRLEGKKFYANMILNLGPANLTYNLERKVFDEVWDKGIRVFYAWYNEKNAKALKRSGININDLPKGTINNTILVKK